MVITKCCHLLCFAELLPSPTKHLSVRTCYVHCTYKSQCVVLGNTHIHPKKIHWEFRGGGWFQKPKFLKENIKLNCNFQTGGLRWGWRLKPRKPSMSGVWVCFGIPQSRYLAQCYPMTITIAYYYFDKFSFKQRRWLYFRSIDSRKYPYRPYGRSLKVNSKGQGVSKVETFKEKYEHAS